MLFSGSCDNFGHILTIHFMGVKSMNTQYLEILSEI